MSPLERPPDRAAIISDDGASTSLLGHLKNQVITPGSQSRMIRSGALKGLRMGLDLRHQTQVYLGLYERELHCWLRVLGRHALTAIDVGAADGAYSLYFLMRTNAQSVFAFEPDPAARKLMLLNLRLNRFENDRLHLFDAPVGSGRAPNTVALDSLSSRIQPPCLVKVDVEGDEVDVLEGASALLSRGASSWIIETHSLELEQDCIRRLEGYGLNVTVVSPAWWRFAVPETRPISHNRWLIAHEKRLALR